MIQRTSRHIYLNIVQSKFSPEDVRCVKLVVARAGQRPSWLHRVVADARQRPERIQREVADAGQRPYLWRCL